MFNSIFNLFTLFIILGIYQPQNQTHNKEPDSFRVSIYTITDRVCDKDSLCLTAEAKGGSGNYFYLWFTSNSCQNYTTKTITIYPRSSLWIYVKVKDNENMFTSSDSLFIEYSNKK